MNQIRWISTALGVGLWLVFMAAVSSRQPWLNLSNTPVLLVLVSSMCSLLLPLWLSLVLSGAAVLLFNFHWVPPVGTLQVDLSEHASLLLTILGVSTLITHLLRQQREIALKEQLQAQRTLQLMEWSEALRAMSDPKEGLHLLLQRLENSIPSHVSVVLGFEPLQTQPFKVLTPTQIEAFQACLEANQPLGLGTERYANLNELYLPMRGQLKAYGVCVCFFNKPFNSRQWVPTVQALLDQMGLACERQESMLRAQIARESAQQQEARSLFLTAIAHDQRTPLASIVTSASAIVEQITQLSKADIQRYAELIQAESQQVVRLTENTLSLAKLNASGGSVPLQAESAEDIVAAVLQRIRQRKGSIIPSVVVQPNLPLVNCNMVLVEQVLDNLIDNAHKHSGAPHTVRVSAFLDNEQVVFEVQDQGRGFEASPLRQGDEGRGLGLGLQLCQAVAAAHGGRLWVVPQSDRVKNQRGCGVRFSLPAWNPEAWPA